jgi:hypothetical protein
MSIKQKFKSMCEYINVSDKGVFYPYDTKNFIGELLQFKNDPDYPILKEKMDNLVILINSDHSLIVKDASTELWDLI